MKTETVEIYQTRTGKIAAELKKITFTNSEAWSWSGTLGAASGTEEGVRSSLASALAHRKGITRIR